MRSNKGFTLVELLMVVVILGVLSGVVINVINPESLRGGARDGIRMKKVKEIAETIETYRQSEYEYPPEESINNPNSTLRTVYLKEWPQPLDNDGNQDPENWSYEYGLVGTNGFVVLSPNSLGGCYKYQSDWAQIMDCPVSECSVESFSSSESCNKL